METTFSNNKIKQTTPRPANGQSTQTTISEYFGRNVFNKKTMDEFMDQASSDSFQSFIENKSALPVTLIEEYCQALKRWAIERGVTHYTHWFQPLTNVSAEKHDTFFKTNSAYGGIEKLKVSDLIQKEPDASSFPSGGLRSTDAARGYSIWDPTSPPFILENAGACTLYIPAIYISWTGEALDYKTPLLRSEAALSKVATDILNALGQRTNRVNVTLGWEQEYFLIDEQLYRQRPDLMQAGRTLFGNRPARHQQLEDHYFGVIPDRALRFMSDFEKEAQLVGIPVVTRHNEVAPNQFECAPIFEEVNVANDHNVLVMKIMNHVARKHGLVVLFHEKPFAGVNGIGKHNNWSMSTANGMNLLEPGDDPGNNLIFLTFFINVIAAIHDNEELIRASIATPGNDFRLGAQEAPPAIISVFTGETIMHVLSKFKDHGLHHTSSLTSPIELGLSFIPPIKVDSTDRNRTSPFPFTGNKFEYRAVGASANCAQALIVLQTAVAHQLTSFLRSVQELMKQGSDVQNAFVNTLQHTLLRAEKIIFNGNGYSEEWQIEAAKRGLSNNKKASDALGAYLADSTYALFTKTKVLSAAEVMARYEIFAEEYIKKIEIEAIAMLDITRTQIVPAVNEYFNTLTVPCQRQSEVNYKFENIKNMQLHVNSNLIHSLLEHLNKTHELTSELDSLVARLHHVAAKHGSAEALQFCGNEVKSAMELLRKEVDQLESITAEKFWPMPKYRQLLSTL